MFAGEDPLAASGVAQKAAQSSAPAEAAATLGSDSLGSAPTHPVGSNFLTSACARRMQASRRSGAPVCLGLSNERSVLRRYCSLRAETAQRRH